MPCFNVRTLSSSLCEEPAHRRLSCAIIWVGLCQQSSHAKINHCKNMHIFTCSFAVKLGQNLKEKKEKIFKERPSYSYGFILTKTNKIVFSTYLFSLSEKSQPSKTLFQTTSDCSYIFFVVFRSLRLVCTQSYRFIWHTGLFAEPK